MKKENESKALKRKLKKPTSQTRSLLLYIIWRFPAVFRLRNLSIMKNFTNQWTLKNFSEFSIFSPPILF